MERTNVQDFRSNISCGGIGSVCDLRDDFIEIAIKAARAVGADYCGVDILLGANNEPIVCEVNSNALFTHIEKSLALMLLIIMQNMWLILCDAFIEF